MKLADGPVTLETNGIGSGKHRTIGYHRWRDYHAETEHHYSSRQETVYVHQLVAIAQGADPYDVFANGKNEVHHQRLEWADDRPVIEWNVRGYLSVDTHVDHWNRHIHDKRPENETETERTTTNDSDRVKAD